MTSVTSWPSYQWPATSLTSSEVGHDVRNVTAKAWSPAVMEHDVRQFEGSCLVFCCSPTSWIMEAFADNIFRLKMARYGIDLACFVKTIINLFGTKFFPLCTPRSHTPTRQNPIFCCFHGNWQKMENSEIVQKFMGPLDCDFQGVWLRNPGPS